MCREDWVTKDEYDGMILQKTEEAQLSDIKKVAMFLPYMIAIITGFIFTMVMKLGVFGRVVSTSIVVVVLTLLFFIAGIAYQTPKYIEAEEEMYKHVDTVSEKYFVDRQYYTHSNLFAMFSVNSIDNTISEIKVYYQPIPMLVNGEVDYATATRVTPYEEKLVRGHIRDIHINSSIHLTKSLIPLALFCLCLAIMISIGWFWRSHYWELKNMPTDYFVSLFTKALTVMFLGCGLSLGAVYIFSTLFGQTSNLFKDYSIITFAIFCGWVIFVAIFWQMKSRVFAPPNDVHKLKVAVREEDTEAMLHLADAYIYGYGVNTNYTRAYRLLSRVAIEGNATAQYKLGLLYCAGNGVTEDISEAIRLFETAAENGEADAQYTLYCLFSTGKFVEQDSKKALFWLNKMQQLMNKNTETRIFKLGMKLDWSEQISRADVSVNECLKMGS